MTKRPDTTSLETRTGPRPLSVGLRLAGIFLLLVPFLPIRLMYGEIPGTTWLVDPQEWLLGLLVFGALAWLLALLLPGIARRLQDAVRALEHWPGDAAFRLTLLAGLAGILVVTSVGAFARRPLLIDSIIHLFQSRIFASGRLAAPAPPSEAFFATQHMIVDGGMWYSQYPPGHAALLAAGTAAGATWLIPILVTIGTGWVLYGFARRIYDRRTARLTLALVLLSPFFWFMGASHMNHVSALFFVALFLSFYARWHASGGAGWLALSGVALGAGFLSRPLTALAIGIAFALIAVPKLRLRPVHALAGVAGFALCAGLYLVFNALTTGDPFLTGYVKLWGVDHGLGFHATPWGDVHSPAAGLRSQLVDLALLNVFLFEWPIPGLLPIALFLTAGWANRGWDGRLLLGFLALPAAYFFYWHRDAFLGPRFLYAGVAFALPLTARAILATFDRVREELPGRPAKASRRRSLGAASRAGVATSLLLLCFGYAVFYGTPQRFRIYRTGMQSLKLDLAREAAEAGIQDGIIFVAVSWGNRLLARLRAAGVQAALAERVYRRADHCELEETLRRAETEAWEPARLITRVEGLVRPEEQTRVQRLNDDPTLRLVPGRQLTAACLAELQYDQAGYTLYSPHLATNRADLSGPYVFARDLRDRNGELRAALPARPAYLYRPGRFLRLE